MGAAVCGLSGTRMAQLLETGQAEYNVPMLSLKNVRILSDRMPIREDGKIVGVVAIFRNKTEVSRMAEELTGVHYMVVHCGPTIMNSSTSCMCCWG